MNNFVYRKGVTTEDDIIEHLLTLLNTSHAGGAVQVPAFCHLEGEYDYDRIMEPMVRDKMKRHDVAVRSRGGGQPETAVELTPRGAKIYQAGGWNAYLNSLENRKRKEAEAQFNKERIEQEKADLERQKSSLEVEKLIYEKENRVLTEEVQRLTAQNLKLQRAEMIIKWVYGIGGIIAACASSILLEIQWRAVSKLAKLLTLLL